ncbi:MAG: DUF5671 domain-containing protein [Candidatus Pacebacteria bacterium]|nr:DUF5671 domain-containing protein [Candidatus Paceibacterota bacterium]
MDKPKTTPKDFFMWAGAVVAFYWSVIAYIFLVFNYIDFVFPNVLTYYPSDPYQSGISYQMASIIVLLPLYLLLMKLIRRDIARDLSRSEIWVRRWALILTLFVAGAAIAGDLITLLTTFLSGEALTVAFLLKTLTIFLIAGGVFLHFISDLRGYWTTYPARKRAVSIGVALLAAVTIISGFFIVGTPAEARLARFDTQKVNDLQNIQYQIINYYQAKQKLPGAITDLENTLSYGSLPIDPQSGDAYGYQPGEGLSFKLCATFNTASRMNYAQTSATVPVGIREKGQDNWQHGAGQVCFDRVVDPAFYPPLTKVAQPVL